MTIRLLPLAILLGLASTTAPAVRADSPPAACTGCNVVVVLIDTLRADHLGAYGYDRDTSPNIDAVAREAVVFRNVVAQSTWTKPATASLLTGLYPKNHGANRLRDRLSDDRILLSEYLRRAGYRTYGFVANGNAGPLFNFDRGYDTFEFFSEDPKSIDETRRSDRVNAKLLPFLESIDPTESFLLYVHYVDPHDPYTPGEKAFSRGDAMVFDRRFFRRPELTPLPEDPVEPGDLRRQLVNAYDDEIRFNDASVGQLLATLKEMGVFDRTLVLIVSDHGEALLEGDRLGHAKAPYEEQVRVPLILRVPGMRPRRVDEAVELVDVVPTLLPLLGLAVPSGVDGENALRADLGERAAFAELDSERLECTAVWLGREKLSRCSGPDAPSDSTQYFLLDRDPGESENRYGSAENAARVGALESAIEAYRATESAPTEPDRVELGERQREALRMLGYGD